MCTHPDRIGQLAREDTTGCWPGRLAGSIVGGSPLSGIPARKVPSSPTKFAPTAIPGCYRQAPRGVG